MDPYRILVTGSRDWDQPEVIWEALERQVQLHVPADREGILVHGGARGADAIAADWAYRYGLGIEEHRAEWDRHGRAAGHIRNALMVGLGAHVCLAFIKNASRGATNCAALAERAHIPIVRYCC